jgi:hypothetical protein
MNQAGYFLPGLERLKLTIMKKLAELLALAIQQNSADTLTWMFNYYGHVNQIDIRFYPKGFNNSEHEDCEKFETYLVNHFDGKPNNKAVNEACRFIDKHLKTLKD